MNSTVADARIIAEYEKFILERFGRPASDLKVVIYGLQMQICGGLLNHVTGVDALLSDVLENAGRVLGKGKHKVLLPEMYGEYGLDTVILVSLYYESEYDDAVRKLREFGVPLANIAHARPLAETVLRISGEYFAQNGMDLYVKALFDSVGRNIADIRYMDIGANNYIFYNNTYLFYKAGAHGVLVEANVDFCELMRENRPRDTVLNCGCAPDAQDAAMTYYKTSRAGRNTFLYDMIAKRVASGELSVLERIEVPMRSIRDIIGEHFPERHIDYLSIDAEGMGVSILDAIDLTEVGVDVILIEMNRLDARSRELYIKLDKLGYSMEHKHIGMANDFLFYKTSVFEREGRFEFT